MRSRIWRPLSALVIGSLAAACVPPPSTAGSFRIEAETFTSSGDGGGYPVEDVACSGASGGRGVKGVDSPGDWVSWRHEFTARTCFVDSLRSQGQSGFARTYAVLYVPDSPVTTSAIDTTTTPAGAGIG